MRFVQESFKIMMLQFYKKYHLFDRMLENYGDIKNIFDDDEKFKVRSITILDSPQAIPINSWNSTLLSTPIVSGHLFL